MISQDYRLYRRLFQLLILASHLLFLMGCSNQQPLAKFQKSPQMPNLQFDQTGQLDKTGIPSKDSNRFYLAMTASEDALSKTDVKNPFTKTHNNTVYQSHKLHNNTRIKVSKMRKDPTPIANKSKDKKSGLGATVTGLICNSSAFLSGVLLAATLGIGWGSVQGLFWILWILGCIPLLIGGLIFTIVGMIKMSQSSDNENAKQQIILPAISILALLGAILIFFILIGS
jgi:hypothetical protein